MHLEPTKMTACANVRMVPTLLDSQANLAPTAFLYYATTEKTFFRIKYGLNVTMFTTVSHRQNIHSKNSLKIIYKKHKLVSSYNNNPLLRKIFVPRREELIRKENNCMMRNSVFCVCISFR